MSASSPSESTARVDAILSTFTPPVGRSEGRVDELRGPSTPEIVLAWRGEEPRFRTSTRPPSAVKRAGIRYEARVLDALTALHPGVLKKPWFWYQLKSGYRTLCCQPDAVLLTAEMAFVVEIKRRPIPEMWGQVHLYRWVVEKALNCTTRAVGVTTRLDPALRFPSMPRRLGDLRMEGFADLLGSEEWGIFEWTPP